jgi:hypothetical protein
MACTASCRRRPFRAIQEAGERLASDYGVSAWAIGEIISRFPRGLIRHVE